MLEKHKENIVFIDCDAEVLEYPDLFERIPDSFLFAAHRLNRYLWYNIKGGEQFELQSGTLFIRNCLESKRIVSEWAMTCKLIPDIWEQKVLDTVLKKNSIDVFELPIEYCWIKTMPNGSQPLVKPNGNIVVQHNQVSRDLRNKVSICQPTL